MKEDTIIDEELVKGVKQGLKDAKHERF